MNPQIQMSSCSRQAILDRHDFFVTQIKKRIFSQFTDMEAETDNFAVNEYDRFGSLPGSENFDSSDIAEKVRDRAYDFYSLLCDLKLQTLLGSIAGMYHQWEKELRGLLQNELNHSYDQKDVYDGIWKCEIDKVFGKLKEFGWNYRNFEHPSKLRACGLVVNVYKHGNGRSLNELAELYGNYINKPTLLNESRLFYDSKYVYLDYRWLLVSETHFDEFAAALRSFWEDFPEKLVSIQEPGK